MGVIEEMFSYMERIMLPPQSTRRFRRELIGRYIFGTKETE